MADNVKVKFSSAYQVKGKDGPFYKEGQTVSLEPASAQHFINRGVAEEVGRESAKVESAAPEQAVDIDAMTKAELEEHAKASGIEGVNATMPKDEMVKAIKRAPKR